MERLISSAWQGQALATAGKKRARSLSPPSTRKRRSILPSPPYSIENFSSSEEKWHCPSCGQPCWLCRSSSKLPPNEPITAQKEHRSPEGMASGTPTDTPSATTSTAGAISGLLKQRNRKQYEGMGLTYLGPKDTKFPELILRSCGVFLGSAASENRTVADIFGSGWRTPVSRVFISENEQEMDEIRVDFAECHGRGYNEHSFSTVSLDSIVRRDRFVLNKLFDDEPLVVSIRRDKWKPGREGPSFTVNKYIYDWDLEPDATYAVSTTMFKVAHRRELTLGDWSTYLAEDTAFCPYLTIEFKCLDKSGKSLEARNQCVAASLIWLHQRKEVRNSLNLPPGDLRHYYIIIHDYSYIIGEVRFREGFYWQSQLASGSLTKKDALREYVRWSNAIHAWGLGTYALSFKEDIETLIDRKWAVTPAFFGTGNTISSMPPPPIPSPGTGDPPGGT